MCELGTGGHARVQLYVIKYLRTVGMTLFNDNFEGTTSAKLRNMAIPLIILWFLVFVFAILLFTPSSEIKSNVAISAHLRDVGVMFGSLREYY